jgi:ABC-type phosphate transport system substrate-binding protein
VRWRAVPGKNNGVALMNTMKHLVTALTVLALVAGCATDKEDIARPQQVESSPDALIDTFAGGGKADFDKLVRGEADMILSFAPSPEAAALFVDGAALEKTPIGEDALVFVVHTDNPVKYLTLEQLQGIYSGVITNWREVGGEDRAIRPFGRLPGSPIQTVMERLVTKDAEHVKAIFCERSQTDCQTDVETLRDEKYAISYTSARIAKQYPPEAHLRVLGFAFHGSEVTDENYKYYVSWPDGYGRVTEGYPFFEKIFLLTRKGALSERSRSLRDWFLGDEGQQYIENRGYERRYVKSEPFEQVIHSKDETPFNEEDPDPADTDMLLYPGTAEYSTPGGKWTPLRGRPTVIFSRAHPVIDGATAFVPLYGAAANALYRLDRKADKAAEEAYMLSARCSTTPNAYSSLIKGHVDMIFALEPSRSQIRQAAEKGISFNLTPVAREAFVFFVNEKNPVRGLGSDHVRAIYSGSINNWRETGGPDGQITPFQREADSGSQTVMEQLVMRGQTLRKPLVEEKRRHMFDIILVAADYRNWKSALGYSFRFYATEMVKKPEIRLLAIDDVAPTLNNIENGRYPFVATVYMVTARPMSKNTRKLHDWFLSKQGQQLVRDVGYAPIRATEKR